MFCTNCGFALSSAAQSRNVGSAGEVGEAGINHQEQSGLDYEMELENEYSDMHGLDVEITNPHGHSSAKLSDLMGTAPERPGQDQQGQSKKRGRPKSKKRVLDEFKDESGAIRENQKEN